MKILAKIVAVKYITFETQYDIETESDWIVAQAESVADHDDSPPLWEVVSITEPTPGSVIKRFMVAGFNDSDVE
jgi:hypothetical protein